MKNTPKLLAGLVALTPLFLTTLTAQAHNGVDHAKGKAATKKHVHSKSDKPHAVKSASKMSSSKMSGMKMSGGKMSGMKMPAKK